MIELRCMQCHRRPSEPPRAVPVVFPERGPSRVICDYDGQNHCDFAAFSSRLLFRLESRDWLLRDDPSWWTRPSWWSFAGGRARTA